MFNQQITPIVKNLMIVNVVVFLLQYLSGGIVNQYLALFDVRSSLFMPHQFISYMFLHSLISIRHILFNMLALFFMGPMLEKFLGDRKFFILYMISGVGAGIIQALVYYIQIPTEAIDVSTLPVVVGASGAIAGVIMAVAILFPNTEVYLMFIPIPIKLKYLAFAYVAYELFNGLTNQDSDIAHFAHLGGMLFGFVLIKIWNQGRKNFY